MLVLQFHCVSGLCFAELRSRVPRVKSTVYEYVFCILGEAAAFLTGWLLLLQQAACTSAVARAISQNFDGLLGNRILNVTVTNIGMIDGLGSSLDFVAFFIVLMTMTVTSVGVKGPSDILALITNASTAVFMLFLSVISLFHVDFSNWDSKRKFFPQGVAGVSDNVCVYTGIPPS